MTDTQTSEWIEHDGKGMPVDGDVFVNVRFRQPTGEIDEESRVMASALGTGGETSLWVWHVKCPEDDVIAYRVVKP